MQVRTNLTTLRLSVHRGPSQSLWKGSSGCPPEDNSSSRHIKEHWKETKRNVGIIEADLCITKQHLEE